MRDIQNREDIILLVDAFYRKVLVDDIIGIFFTETVILDWEKHIPVMYDFWDTTLLDAGIYKANAMQKHLDLHAKRPLEEKHFLQWIHLWQATIDGHYQGKNCTTSEGQGTANW